MRKQETAKRSSITAAAERAQDLTRGLASWPSTVERLDDEARQTKIDAAFALIVSQRPASGWPPLDLHRAAQLAAWMVEQDHLTNVLSRAGSMVKGDRGMKPSPVLYALKDISNLVQTASRSLGLTWQAVDRRTERGHNAEFAASAGPQLIEGRAEPAAQPIDARLFQ